MATDLNDFWIINIIVDQPLHNKRPGPMIWSLFSVTPTAAYIFFMISPSLWIPTGALRNHPWHKRQKNASKWKKNLIKTIQNVLKPGGLLHSSFKKYCPLFLSIFSRLSYTPIILLIIHFNHSFTNIQSIHYYSHHYYCRLHMLLSPTCYHCSQYDQSHSSCTFHQV